jgi:hypothetical protein
MLHNNARHARRAASPPTEVLLWVAWRISALPVLLITVAHGRLRATAGAPYIVAVVLVMVWAVLAAMVSRP